MKRLAVCAALALVTACGDWGSVPQTLDLMEPAQVEGMPTPPPPSTPTSSPPPVLPTARFAVIGDWGSGLPMQYQIARRMCRWDRGHRFEMVVTTGDNVYPTGDPSLFRKNFFQPMSCLLARGIKFHAVLGNHDYAFDRGRPEIRNSRFGMKARNYVIRHDGVRFVMADSNNIDRAWLRRAVHGRIDDRWTIVVFHHPPFSPGTEHGSSMGLRSLQDLFVKRGVDLVLNGHDHIYSVSRPLRRVRYVVTGGGGGWPYPCGPKQWFTAVCKRINHFLYVVATPLEIRVRAVPISGRPFHSFTTMGREPFVP